MEFGYEIGYHAKCSRWVHTRSVFFGTEIGYQASFFTLSFHVRFLFCCAVNKCHASFFAFDPKDFCSHWASTHTRSVKQSQTQTTDSDITTQHTTPCFHNHNNTLHTTIVTTNTTQIPLERRRHHNNKQIRTRTHTHTHWLRVASELETCVEEHFYVFT